MHSSSMLRYDVTSTVQQYSTGIVVWCVCSVLALYSSTTLASATFNAGRMHPEGGGGWGVDYRAQCILLGARIMLKHNI